jgi:hypothetical protein
LLGNEKAAENFDYFMRVRQQRIAYFRDWVQRHFGVMVTLDEQGIRALSQWGSEYAGFLLVRRADRPYLIDTTTYLTYDPPWTGENAGHNVLIDMGIVLGETIIAHCPRLHWDFDPISAVVPRLANQLKGFLGSDFQRPMLTGFDNPAYGKSPLLDLYRFACQMMQNMTTLEGLEKFYEKPRRESRRICDSLTDAYLDALKHYPDGDPGGMRKELGDEKYLELIDAESEDEDHDNE